MPLSAAAIAILETVQPLARGPNSLVFPGGRAGRPDRDHNRGGDGQQDERDGADRGHDGRHEGREGSAQRARQNPRAAPERRHTQG